MFAEKIAAIALFLFITTSTLFGQGTLFVLGKMKLEEGKLDGKMEVLEDGRRIRIVDMTGSGKFEQKVDLNKEYIFSFSQEGYVTKKIAVSTDIPSDFEIGEYPYEFEFQVTLFKQYEGVNFVVFNQPVGMVHFDPSMDGFNWDTDYTKSIQERVDEAVKEVEEKKKEEARKVKEEPKPEPEKKEAPVIKEEVTVRKEDPPTTPKKRTPPPPPPPPKKKGPNVVVLHSYTVGEMGYPNLNAYGFINFGDGTGRREITKEQFDEYAKQYR